MSSVTKTDEKVSIVISPAEHLLAGAGLAGDHDRGVGARDLLRQLDHPAHRLVAPDQVARVVGDRAEHGRDQFRIGRQRDVFLGAGVDRGDRGAGIVGDAAGDAESSEASGLASVAPLIQCDEVSRYQLRSRNRGSSRVRQCIGVRFAWTYTALGCAMFYIRVASQH